MSTSRMVPPPMATTTARTIAPSQSIDALAAAITPEMAKVTVPMTSMTRKMLLDASLPPITRQTYPV